MRKDGTDKTEDGDADNNNDYSDEEEETANPNLALTMHHTVSRFTC